MVEARKLSPKVAEFVGSRVKWDPDSKALLSDGLAECAVKYLNLARISAEYLPEIKTGIAALSILHARSELIEQLRKMAADEDKARRPVSEERKAA